MTTRLKNCVAGGLVFVAFVLGAVVGSAISGLLDDPPAPIETRVVYVGPAAQIVDTVKTQIEPDKEGRLRMERRIITYSFRCYERDHWWKESDPGGAWVSGFECGGPRITALYQHTRTLTDTVCYEPVECGGGE